MLLKMAEEWWGQRGDSQQQRDLKEMNPWTGQPLDSWENSQNTYPVYVCVYFETNQYQNECGAFKHQ